jgi:hypothetical protein
MESARRSPTVAAAQLRDSRPRCRRCAKGVTVEGDREWGVAFHTATGQERGPDGHLVAPIEGDVLVAFAGLRAGAGS